MRRVVAVRAAVYIHASAQTLCNMDTHHPPLCEARRQHRIASVVLGVVPRTSYSELKVQATQTGVASATRHALVLPFCRPAHSVVLLGRRGTSTACTRADAGLLPAGQVTRRLEIAHCGAHPTVAASGPCAALCPLVPHTCRRCRLQSTPCGPRRPCACSTLASCLRRHPSITHAPSREKAVVHCVCTVRGGGHDATACCQWCADAQQHV